MNFFDTEEGRTAVLLIANSLANIAQSQAKTAYAAREVSIPLGNDYKLVVKDGLTGELVAEVRGKKGELIKTLFTISTESGNEGLAVTVRECEESQNSEMQIRTYFDL